MSYSRVGDNTFVIIISSIVSITNIPIKQLIRRLIVDRRACVDDRRYFEVLVVE